MNLNERIRQLERKCAPAGDGWQPYEPEPPPDLDGDGPWAKLKRIRDSRPELQSKSLMDMAEDLIPGFKQSVKESAEAYRASHEWRRMNGRCYVRERPRLRGRA